MTQCMSCIPNTTYPIYLNILTSFTNWKKDHDKPLILVVTTLKRSVRLTHDCLLFFNIYFVNICVYNHESWNFLWIFRTFNLLWWLFCSQQNRTGVSEPALRVWAARPQETEATGERAEGSGGHQPNRLRGQVTNPDYLLTWCLQLSCCPRRSHCWFWSCSRVTETLQGGCGSRSFVWSVRRDFRNGFQKVHGCQLLITW